jgi:hypothetical protein
MYGIVYLLRSFVKPQFAILGANFAAVAASGYPGRYEVVPQIMVVFAEKDALRLPSKEYPAKSTFPVWGYIGVIGKRLRQEVV